MSVNRAALGRMTRSEVTGIDLTRWKRIIRGLPNVRLDKVRSTREALRGDCYDGEAVIEETIRRLCNDVGILCRKDAEVGPI